MYIYIHIYIFLKQYYRKSLIRSVVTRTSAPHTNPQRARDPLQTSRRRQTGTGNPRIGIYPPGLILARTRDARYRRRRCFHRENDTACFKFSRMRIVISSGARKTQRYPFHFHRTITTGQAFSTGMLMINIFEKCRQVYRHIQASR